jgi:hypothetical protein
MRQDRFVQWFFLHRCYSPADSTHRARSHSARAAGSSDMMEATSGLKTSCNSVCGLLGLLHADSSLATAYAAGLISTQTDVWCGTRGDASSASSSSERDAAATCRKHRQQQRQSTFSAPAAQAPLVKQLAAVFEGCGSRRNPTESSLSTADASVLVSVTAAAAKLESVPSIRSLLQTWESLSTAQPPSTSRLSRSSSCSSSSSSSSCGGSRSSSSYQPQKPLLRPLTAATLVRAQPQAAVTALTSVS